MAKRQQHYSKLSGMLASLPTSTKANSMTPRGSKPECGFTQERSVFDLSRPSSSNKLSDMGKKSQSQYQWQQKNVLLESQFNSQLLSQPQTIGDKSNSESKRTFKTRGAGLSSQRLSNSMLLSKDLPPRSISKEKDSALKILVRHHNCSAHRLLERRRSFTKIWLFLFKLMQFEQCGSTVWNARAFDK